MNQANNERSHAPGNSYHANACNTEEITNEGIRRADAAEAHKSETQGGEGGGEGTNRERSL
jgi:hypothetical protein